MVSPGEGPHEHSWLDFHDELISNDILSPLPSGGSSGVAVPSSTASSATVANDNVADADIGALTGIALFEVNDNLGTWWYSLNNGATWELVGDVSPSAARMLAADGVTRLYFQPNANVSGEISDAIHFRAWDQTDGFANGSLRSATSTGGSTALSDQISAGWLYVTPLNDSPDVAGVSARTVTANEELDLSSLQIVDIDGGNVRVEISVSSGTLSLSTYDGLTFLTGDGSTDERITFTSSLVDANAALATLRYVSNPSFVGVDGISVFVDDQSNGGIGGAQTATSFSQIEVIAAPAPPTPPPPGPPTPPSPPQPPKELPEVGAPVYVSNAFDSSNWLSNATSGRTGWYSSAARTTYYDSILPSPPPLPDPAHESFRPAVRVAPSTAIEIIEDQLPESASLQEPHSDGGESDASAVEEFNELGRTSSDAPIKPAVPFAPVESMPLGYRGPELEVEVKESDEMPPEQQTQPAEDIAPQTDEESEAVDAEDANTSAK